MGQRTRQRDPHHVIVIAGASGCGKTHLIRRMSQRPHDAFVTTILKQLKCDPHQRLKRSTVERLQRLMDPTNPKKRKKRKLKHCLLVHIDLTSINHRSNLRLLHHIATRAKRFDVLTLYAPPQEWRTRILHRLHSDDEPSMRAALIALSAHLSKKLSSALYHREYKKWLEEIKQFKTDYSCNLNGFSETILTEIPPKVKTSSTSKA